MCIASTADQKEFTKLCQAIGIGFLIMGVVGYVVKLSKALLPSLAGCSRKLIVAKSTYRSTKSSSAARSQSTILDLFEPWTMNGGCVAGSSANV